MKTTIKSLFNIEWGQKEYHSKEHLIGNEGNVMLIASGGINNGVYGFFDICKKYKAPFISVPSTGSIGQAFLQQYDCCVNDDVLILKPKKELSYPQLIQVVYQVRKNKWRYSYGRKITPERLMKQEIVLEELKINIENLSKNLLPKKNQKQKIQENSNIQIMRVKDLCNIVKKTATPQNAINLNGNIPYVTTTSMNNGVSQFTDEKPNFKGKCLSIALNGSVGEVFFQIDDFITSGDNAVLTIKKDYNPYLLLYIGALIKNHQWRYNYYRKMTLHKLKNLKLPIPLKNKEIDFEYISNIVKNSYGFKEIEDYL